MTLELFWKGAKPEPTPAPGEYDIKSTIGDAPKFTLKSRHEPPPPDYIAQYVNLPSALSTKGKIFRKYKDFEEREDLTSPGPNMVVSFIGSGPASTLHQRIEIKGFETPGPGRYSPKDSSRKLPIKIKSTKRKGITINEASIDPGAYNLPSSTLTGVKKTIGRLPPEKQNKNIFDALYDIRSQTGSTVSSYSIGNKIEIPEKEGPGPGEYSPNDPSHRIGISFHQRTLIPEMPKSDVDYYNFGSTFKPRKVSMGSRPEVSYKTCSPAPCAYDIPSTIKGSPISIHNRIAIKNDDFVPPPWQYFEDKISAAAPKGPTFLSEAKRMIINERESMSLPGPDTVFDPNSMSGKKIRRKIGKKFYFNDEPDVAPPYYPPYSTLGGPMYTIGLKDV